MNRNTKITGGIFSSAVLSAFIYYNAYYVDAVHEELVVSKNNYASSLREDSTQLVNTSSVNQLAEKACKAKDVDSFLVLSDTTEFESELDIAFEMLEVQVSQQDTFCSTFLANLNHT